jgi:hypothetical protein
MELKSRGDTMETQPRSWWRKIQQHPFIATGAVVILAALLVCGFVVSAVGWDWTGFNGGYSQVTTTSTGQSTTTTIVKPGGKTLWDWMQLLLVPLILAIGGFWFSQVQKNSEQKIASDNQRAATLQSYLDRMSELLLEEDLLASDRDDEVRNVARGQTLTVLGSLDANRKRGVILFLYESGLLFKDRRIIDLRTLGVRVDADQPSAEWGVVPLSTADVGAADLRQITLSGVFLGKIDLSGADLYGADLRRTNLSDCDLGACNLREANLNGAKLWKADLSGADLREVDLRRADLQGADLRGADLRRADLREADLSGANLTRVIGTTSEQLERAKSLKGATMPDGSKHL